MVRVASEIGIHAVNIVGYCAAVDAITVESTGSNKGLVVGTILCYNEDGSTVDVSLVTIERTVDNSTQIGSDCTAIVSSVICKGTVDNEHALSIVEDGTAITVGLLYYDIFVVHESTVGND
jgi:hypothetical protein